MLVKINESMAEDKFKDPTINKDAALWNDTRPHYNVGHVVPERDVKFEVIKGHEDHGPQPILVWNGKRLRPRAEMIVFNEKTGEILVRDNPSYKNSNVPFELPGGGLMEGKSFLETAIIEVKQEVRMNVKDAWDSHIYYINQSPDGTEQEWTTWGDYSQICCGICDGLYTGEIDDQDKDEDMARDAKWVRIEDVNLTPAHEEAIRLYRKEKGLEIVEEEPPSNIENDTVHETFGPHIDRTFLEMDLSCLMKNKEDDDILYKRGGVLEETRIRPWFVKGKEAYTSNDVISLCNSPKDMHEAMMFNGVKHEDSAIKSKIIRNPIYRYFNWPDDVVKNRVCNCAEGVVFKLKYDIARNIPYKIVVCYVAPKKEIYWKDQRIIGHMYIIQKHQGIWYASECGKTPKGYVFRMLGTSGDMAKAYSMSLLLYQFQFSLKLGLNMNDTDIVYVPMTPYDVNNIIRMEGKQMNHDEFDKSLESYRQLNHNMNQKYGTDVVITEGGKQMKCTLLKWGDLLDMPGPTPQEIWDEFFKRYNKK